MAQRIGRGTDACRGRGDSLAHCRVCIAGLAYRTGADGGADGPEGVEDAVGIIATRPGSCVPLRGLVPSVGGAAAWAPASRLPRRPWTGPLARHRVPMPACIGGADVRSSLGVGRRSAELNADALSNDSLCQRLRALCAPCSWANGNERPDCLLPWPGQGQKRLAVEDVFED